MNYESGQSSNEDNISQDSQQYELENARRQQMLKDLNLGGWNEFAKDQTKEIFDHFNPVKQNQQKNKPTKKQNVDQQEENQIKKLRMKDTPLFFQKMKRLFLSHVIDSLKFLNKHSQTSQINLPIILSLLNPDLLRKYIYFKRKHPCSISIQEYINFLIQAIEQILNKQVQLSNHQILWSLSKDLGLAFRKVNFFNIQKLHLQIFYDLKFSKIGKKKKGKSQLHEQIKKKIKQGVQQMSNSNQFQNLQEYAFTKNQLQSNSFSHQVTEKRKKFLRSSDHSFYQFFCPLQLKWILFNIQALQKCTIQQTKISYLDGKSIVAFYSTRIIDVKPQYQHLLDIRKLRKVEFKDLIFYADKNEMIQRRRQRLGCGELYKDIMKLGSFSQPQAIMSTLEKIVIKTTQQIQDNYFLDNFPITWEQMRGSQRYVIKSKIPKYMQLKSDAKDIGKLFKEQKVYKKKDLIRLSSRMGWVDVGRMVKEGCSHIKATKNKIGNQTKLYQYGQTQPFYLKIDSVTGQFVTDEQYNSIYVSPKFECPPIMTIIPQNVDYICKKHKFRHCRIVQGFKKANMRVVPNNIGFIVYKENESEIRKLYQQRMKKLKESKQLREDQEIVSMWNKLFKSILVKEQISKLYTL